MELIIKDRIINGDLKIILNKLKNECHKPYLFRDMKESKTDIITTCAFHKQGKEEKASSTFYKLHGNGKNQFGFFHCFACGKSIPLTQVVAHCFDEDIEFAENWLYNNFGGDRYEYNLLPEIDLTKTNLSENKLLDPKILEQYNYYHDYMWERKLTKEIVDKFRIGYDPIRNAITFPVWDEKGVLKFVTARSVTSKRFWIPKDVEKPIYLLNFVLRENPDTLYICESQINTLTMQSWGYPAVGLFGTGSEHQIKTLKRLGIRHLILCLDPDVAGTKSIAKLVKYLPRDILIDVVDMPRNGKDINDYTKEEFESFPIIDGFEYIKKYKEVIENDSQ